MQSDKGTKSNFRDPNRISEKFGNLTANVWLKYPDKYPNTCAAMTRVAQAAARADVAKRDGNDDYTDSLERLMNAFDTFVREYSPGSRTGNKENYNLSKSSELTLLLLWNIRHTWIHNGGLIDEMCKTSYDKIISQANNVNPVSCLPTELLLN